MQTALLTETRGSPRAPSSVSSPVRVPEHPTLRAFEIEFLRNEPPSSFRPASAKHSPAGPRAHSLPEAMSVLPFSYTGLKTPFHVRSPKVACRTREMCKKLSWRNPNINPTRHKVKPFLNIYHPIILFFLLVKSLPNVCHGILCLERNFLTFRPLLHILSPRRAPHEYTFPLRNSQMMKRSNKPCHYTLRWPLRRDPPVGTHRMRSRLNANGATASTRHCARQRQTSTE